MQHNYTTVHVWGIPIRVNISLLVFLPVLVWLIGSSEQSEAYASLIETVTTATVDPTALGGQSARWLVGVGAAVGLFTSVTLHGLGHSWVAMRYDIEVESITLWILGGLADLAEMPKEWNRKFWSAVAGPLTSVGVGVLTIAALTVVPTSATTDLPRIQAETSAFDALQELLSSGQEVAIVERDGGAVGLLSRSEFNEVLTFRRETVLILPAVIRSTVYLGASGSQRRVS